MITTVVSDLGGVLTTPLYDAFVAYEDHSGIELMEFWNALGALGEAAGANPMGELECGRLTEVQFIDALGGQISRQVGHDVDITDFGEVWFSHLHHNTPMLELMRECRDRGFRMGLLDREPRFDLLVILGRLGLYELEAGKLFLSGENETTWAGKRALGIGDPLLLERRSADLASACGVPLAALDLAFHNWGVGSARRTGRGVSEALEPDPDVLAATRGALGI
jgi:hypothetical protein